MNFKKSQSGRSMVEMLGVLAIIGVLSVGGIAGYSLSMRRHRANGVVDVLSKYALVAYNSCYQRMLDKVELSQGSYINDLDDCSDSYPNVVPTFEQADIGQIPAGIKTEKGIRFIKLTENENNDSHNIVLAVSFTDTKLCQTVASITGSEAGDCTIRPDGLIVKIKQN